MAETVLIQSELPEANVESLRSELVKYHQQHPKRRYPDELRFRATGVAQQLHTQGLPFKQIGEQLGLGGSTVLKWVKPRSNELGPQVRKLLPIAISSDAVVLDGLVVHGPSGLRLEGVDMSTLVALWRALSC